MPNLDRLMIHSLDNKANLGEELRHRDVVVLKRWYKLGVTYGGFRLCTAIYEDLERRAKYYTDAGLTPPFDMP